MDIRELDRHALKATGAIIDGLSEDDWTRQTPCRGWTVRDLVTHVIGTNRTFVRQVQGDDGEVPAGSDQDLAEAFRDTGEHLTAALADDAVLDREISLGSFGEFPAKVALYVHFTDILVHGWDLTVAIGGGYRIDDDLARAGLRFARNLPDVPELRGPDAAFDHPIEVSEDAPAGDRLVALLGRDPALMR